MKRLQPIAIIFSLAVLLASCARQNGPQYVGHYKPNTEVAKAQKSPKHEVIQPLQSQADNTLQATTDEVAPDLKLLKEKASGMSEKINLTDKQVKKLSKFIQKAEEKGDLSRKADVSKKYDSPSGSTDKSANHLKTDDATLLYVIVAILIPWLGVALYEDAITSHFWICLLLWFLFYLPGLIYALYIILST